MLSLCCVVYGASSMVCRRAGRSIGQWSTTPAVHGVPPAYCVRNRNSRLQPRVFSVARKCPSLPLGSRVPPHIEVQRPYSPPLLAGHRSTVSLVSFLHLARFSLGSFLAGLLLAGLLLAGLLLTPEE